MPRIEILRRDLPVRISVGKDGPVWRVGAEGFAVEAKGPNPPPELFANLGPESFQVWGHPGASEVIARVALDVTDRQLDAEPWEALLARALPQIPLVVRTSPVRPRFANANLKLPLRILEFGAPKGASVAPAIRGIFSHQDPEAVRQAVVVTSAKEWRAPADWPVVDVLHIGAWPAPPHPLTNDAEREGTLGWFARWTAAWQTRLLAFHCETEAQAAVARSMAQRLCAKGGPAVVIGPAGDEGFWSPFYQRLIHDDPLDLAVARTPGAGPTLFGGAGREEGARVSNAGLAVVGFVNRGWGRVSALSRTVSDDSAGERPGLVDFAKDFIGKWVYELQESMGLLPMAHAVRDLRNQVRTGDLKLPEGSRRPASFTVPSADAAPPERFVNAAFRQEADGELATVTPTDGPLQSGRAYQFGVWIGEPARETPALDAKALLEEDFQWSAEQQGTWVEIGVVGIGCDVAGDPVQPLWLPRTGFSDTAYFSVSFPEAGHVGQIRYGLYYQNNLIQSYRMAALIGPTEKDFRTEIARALSVDAERVNGWHQARLEYSRSSALDAVERKAGRAITIVANELLGDDIVTVKGTDVFETRVYPDGEMKKIVPKVREALYEIAYGAPGGSYRFGPWAENPDGMLADAIRSLAETGYRLFLNLAPDPATQDALNTALTGERKVIHVAQLVREKVVPWAFVYDREYDAATKTRDGKPVQQGVCLAGLGSPGAECGVWDACLLSPKIRASREAAGEPAYLESTVACPLRFWGFRHVIEAPPQQVRDEKQDAREEAACIVPNGPLQFAAGLNGQLPTCSSHWAQLRGLGAGSGPLSDPLYDRDAILDRLRAQDVDFIYFFCHARGGQFDDAQIDPPYLEFQREGAAEAEKILPQNFAGKTKWEHRPLVFLNACGTLGYSPDALSPFLKTLVDGRGAAGVLGTEIPVPEVLAGEVACAFIGRFVKGTSAGTALLEARRELLSRKNPLGLVYTLYAPAALAVDVDGDGKCA
jgi:hypothetical protein